jgi:hypothetical protein
VWCSYCRHQVEPNPSRNGRTLRRAGEVRDWAKRLVCRECGSRNASFVGSGSKHDPPKRILGKLRGQASKSRSFVSSRLCWVDSFPPWSRRNPINAGLMGASAMLVHLTVEWGQLRWIVEHW